MGNWTKRVGGIFVAVVLVTAASPAMALCAAVVPSVPAVISYPDYLSGYVVPAMRTTPCAVVLTRDGYPAIPTSSGRMAYVLGTACAVTTTVVASVVVGVPSVPLSVPLATYPIVAPCPGLVVVP